MWHGLLWAETGGLQVLTAHWSPGDWAFRVKEAKNTVAKIEEAKKSGQPVIVMGDFNNMSPLDASLLAKSRFLDENKQVRKWSADNTGQPSYQAISILMNSGMIDTWAAKTPVDAFNKFQGANWPRIDYIWTTPDLAKRLKKADMHTSIDDMERSDHPPVSAIFRWEGK
jgi:endonuclease/exonuclease/phosphatase family metal-dependent hydrolase